MTKLKKALLLSLALLLPLLIFGFLKFFGKNEFSVEALYQEGSLNPPSGCAAAYSIPYAIPDSVMELFRDTEKTVLYVVGFNGESAGLRRVERLFSDDPVKTVVASSLNLPREQLPFVRDCIVLLPPVDGIALIDDNGRIRGYYRETREEIDRLIVEISIILKK